MAIAAVALGGLWLAPSRTAQTSGLLPVSGAEAQTTEALPVIEDIVLGNPDAAVTFTEYASYTCPHCATFHATVFKDLKRDYIDTGKIKFVYREVFFDRFGLWAAMVARCGGSTERYVGIAEILYSTQRDWAGVNDPAVVAGNLRRIGRTAGLSDAELDVCLSDSAKAQAMIAKFEADTKADDIKATPTIMINGEQFSNRSYADFRAILDAKLGQ